MTLLQTLTYIAEHLPDTTLTFNPVELKGVLEREIAGIAVDPPEMINGSDAAKITRINPRTLRSHAERWYREQQKGMRPRIRVSSVSDKDQAKNSPWLYSKPDCLALAESVGFEPLDPTINRTKKPTLPPAPSAAEGGQDESVDDAADRYAAAAVRAC